MDAADFDQDFLRVMADFHQRLWLGYGNEPADRLEPALNHAPGERLFNLDDDELFSDQSRVRTRLALPVPPMNGEADPNQGPEIWPTLESALQACSRAGIPLVTATLVMPPGAPVDLDYMKPVLAWLGGLMETMKGGFEVDLEPVFSWAAGGDSNPEAYVPLSRYEDVWEEFPGLDPERVFAAGRGIRGYLTGIMRDILQRGIIPHEVLLKHFELYRGQGLHSVWLDNVFLPDVRVHNYYVMMSRGAVKRLEDIDHAQRNDWRPQRTIDLWGAADFSGGFARIGRHALSPLEYQLLLFSTGKQTLGQVLRAVHQRFADRFQGYDDFAEVALEILRQFETRLWLAYSQL
jgi:hypothetical protein